MSLLKGLFGFIGRALFSLFFIAGGLHAFLHWGEAEQLFISKLHDWTTLYLGNAQWQDHLEWALAHLRPVLFGLSCLKVLGGIMSFWGSGCDWALFCS